jgi:HKD family nuclease
MQGKLVETRGTLATAFRNLLNAQRRPTVVRILTYSIGQFVVNNSVSFLRKVRMLISSDVTVTVIFGRDPGRMSDERMQFLKELQNSGVKLYHNRRMHAKVILSKRGTSYGFLIGSANMTKTAFHKNYEMAIWGDVSHGATCDALESYVQRVLSAESTRPFSDYVTERREDELV